jgi:hypothetical protein
VFNACAGVTATGPLPTLPRKRERVNLIRSRARTPPASDVKQRILFASPLFGDGDQRAFNPERTDRAVAEQLFAARLRQITNKREAERRQTRAIPPARIRRAGRGARHGRSGLRRAVRYGRARLPAFHLGSAKGTYVTQGATQAMLPGTRSERVLPAFACPSPVSTSHAGR